MTDTRPSTVNHQYSIVLNSSTVRLFILGAFLCFFGVYFVDDLVGHLEEFLPESMTVKSAGVFYPSFGDEHGFAWQLRHLFCFMGALLVCSPLYRTINVVLTRGEGILERKAVFWSLSFFIALLTGAAYWFYAYPPNAFPSNTIIHWVENFSLPVYRSRYPLIGGIQIFFYDYPEYLMGVLGVVCSLLFSLNARVLLSNRLTTLFAQLSFSVSGLMFLFANMSEGFHIVTVTLLLASLCYSTRRPYLLGAVIFLNALARPQLILLLPTFLFVEFVALMFRVRDVREATVSFLRDKFVWSNFLMTLLPYVCYQVATAVLGYNMFYQVGAYSVSDYLFSKNVTSQPVSVDGFVASMLSGAYIFHTLWSFPLPVLFFALVSLKNIRALPLPVSRSIGFLLLFASGMILFHDLFPINYYNLRYLCYVYPFVLLASWCVLKAPVVRNEGGKLFATLLLAVCPLFVWNDAGELRKRLKKHPIAQMEQVRYELRAAREEGGHERIYTTFPRKTDRNYLAYIFRLTRKQILYVRTGFSSSGALLITERADDFDCQVIHRRGRIAACLFAKEKG